MEMYIDSYDWVMVPNVYGMGSYADGGIFSTKPYICGSSYMLRMSNFKKGDWCDVVDGLYWKFVDKNIKFFASNPRLAIMTKSLEKMDFVDAVITDRSIKFSFPKPKNLGTSMIVLNEVDVGYEKNNPVLQGINLSISNDSRIALLGANGNGKSTLIKLISGIIKPMKGTISKNKNIKIGYFAQHLSEELELDLTPFEVLSEKLKNEEDLKIRGVLGKFGFDKTKSETKIHKLSGGEKTRLILCLISYDSPNILLLDEPTNLSLIHI